ncbi:MAG: hypothetical protein AAFQ91_31190 [Cyanobacteria bacterium J06621_15]
MNLEQVFLIFLLIGTISAVTLLAFPKISYMLKVISISLTCGLWIYLSINFITFNLIYITKYKTGIFSLIAMVCEIAVSILAASLIMAFLIEKKKIYDSSSQ